jgi:hypothetical protein
LYVDFESKFKMIGGHNGVSDGAHDNCQYITATHGLKPSVKDDWFEFYFFIN